MNIRKLVQHAARQIPQIRRLYGRIAQLREENSRLASELTARSQTENAAKLSLKRKEQECKELTSRHDELEKRYNALQSELQRVIGYSDELWRKLRELGEALESARRESKTQICELPTRADLEQFQAPILSRLSAVETSVERVPKRADLEQFQAPILSRLSAVETSVERVPKRAESEVSQSRLLSHLSLLFGELQSVRQLMRAEQQSEGLGIAKMRLYYLDLLEGALTGRIYDDDPMSPWSKGYDPNVRMMGRDWPLHAQTMIGTTRMRNIRTLSEKIIEDDVKGDFLEAGVWRGGACIYMRGILAAYNITDRKVWVADSFAGLPPPNPELFPADEGDLHHTVSQLIVSLDEVRSNFSKYNLLDDQVWFLPGWFKDTLPSAPIERLALLRLDGDMYESTSQALNATYVKLSPGGYIIIDDYILAPCRQAVSDFREENNICEPIQEIDGAGVFWRKHA